MHPERRSGSVYRKIPSFYAINGLNCITTTVLSEVGLSLTHYWAECVIARPRFVPPSIYYPNALILSRRLILQSSLLADKADEVSWAGIFVPFGAAIIEAKAVTAENLAVGQIVVL
jgi:hypothetical protein